MSAWNKLNNQLGNSTGMKHLRHLHPAWETRFPVATKAILFGEGIHFLYDRKGLLYVYKGFSLDTMEVQWRPVYYEALSANELIDLSMAAVLYNDSNYGYQPLRPSAVAERYGVLRNSNIPTIPGATVGFSDIFSDVIAFQTGLDVTQTLYHHLGVPKVVNTLLDSINDL